MGAQLRLANESRVGIDFEAYRTVPRTISFDQRRANACKWIQNQPLCPVGISGQCVFRKALRITGDPRHPTVNRHAPVLRKRQILKRSFRCFRHSQRPCSCHHVARATCLRKRMPLPDGLGRIIICSLPDRNMRTSPPALQPGDNSDRAGNCAGCIVYNAYIFQNVPT